MPGGRWPDPVLLTCDVPVLLSVAAALVCAPMVLRSAELRSRWRRVLADRPAACGMVLLLCFGAVATLDSVHFRRPPDVAPALDTGDTVSLLDLLLAPLAMDRETSYSAPLAVRAFEGGTEPSADGALPLPPRLLAGGAHLTRVDAWRRDLWWRAALGLAGGLAVAVVFAAARRISMARRSWAASAATAPRRAARGHHWPPTATSCMATLLCITVGIVVALASGYHLAGTDRTGNDVFRQALKSVRTAVLIGGLSTVATIPPAVVFGVGGGYLGGWFDAAVRYVYTVLSAVPNVLLIAACMLLLQVHIDAHPVANDSALARADLRLFMLCVLLGLTTWTQLCRVLHARTRQLRLADHVLAAVAGGLGPCRIMWRHVLPNVGHLVLITTALDFSALVLYEAVLTTIGIGVDPVLQSYGGMIEAARSDLARDPPVWWSFATAFVCLFALVLSANLWADGLRAAFDPHAVALRPRWRARWRRRPAAQPAHLHDQVREHAASGSAGGAALQIDDLHIALATDTGVLPIVDGLALRIAPGETCALVGESGCGKTTTALALLRLLPDDMAITAGSVRLAGVDLLRLPEHAMRPLRGRRIAMVFQGAGSSLDPMRRIGTQVLDTVVRHTGLRGNAARAQALVWLQRVGLPDAAARFDDHPHRLSGGQRQRVAIAVALAGEPDLLVADEPTTGLDAGTAAQIIDLLRSLQRGRRLAVLLITHDVRTVAAIAQRVAVMYAGQIVEISGTERLLNGPCHPYPRQLLQAAPGAVARYSALPAIRGAVPRPGEWPSGCRYAPRCDRADAACIRGVPALDAATGAGPDSGVRCWHPHGPGETALPTNDTGWLAVRAPDQSPPASIIGPEPPLLDVRALRVDYVGRSGWFAPESRRHHRPAVDGVSFTLQAGRTLALVGPSGCGKSTVGQAIVQLLRGRAHVLGEVRLAGTDLLAVKGARLRQARRSMQIVFQDPGTALDPRMSIAGTMTEGLHALCPELDSRARHRAAVSALALVGLEGDVLQRLPHAFSGGQRQRIAIARALAVGPRVVVCDEPTSSLDPSVQAQLLNLLLSLQQSTGLACVLISHDMAVVRHMAHTVLAMDEGRLVQ